MRRSFLLLLFVVACGETTTTAASDAGGPMGVDAAEAAPAVDATVPLDADVEAAAPAPHVLFDGTSASSWKMAGLGSFALVDGALVAQPKGGLGLYWYTVPAPADFVLSLEWKRAEEDDNSGVVIRFPHPDSKGYENTAWVGVHFGLEVQIDELGRPDGANVHKTGAIYEKAGQVEPRKAPKPVGEWSTYEITAKGMTFTVRLDGDVVTTFTYADPPAGLTTNEPRFVGLQAHTGHVSFRNVRWRAL